MEHFGTQWSTLEMHFSPERPEFLARQLGIDVPDYTARCMDDTSAARALPAPIPPPPRLRPAERMILHDTRVRRACNEMRRASP
jgi:hypothetical protein